MVESGLLVEVSEDSDSSKSTTAGGIFPPGKDADNPIGSSLHSGHISEPFPYAHIAVVEVCPQGYTTFKVAVVAGDEKATTLIGQHTSNREYCIINCYRSES
mmetsp:Transcript_17080/g.25325  ORF Transcript_17080/g.25325 Transcript_17080/m.25325 type:complete len:102 (+) Transcript_17080:1091-1396(+)